MWAKTLQLPSGSFVVFDCGFTDYNWYESLMTQKLFFVARVKQNTVIGVYKQQPGWKAPGIKKDSTIHLGDIPKTLRLIEYVDPKTGNNYSFVTNAFYIPTNTVAELYK